MLASYRRTTRAVAVLAALAAVVISCVDAPTTPRNTRDAAAAANNSLLGDLGKVTGGLQLLSCTRQTYDSVTKVIGKEGGTIDVGQHLFVVPKGALKNDVSITAVAPAVKRREVRFQPEGLQFESPASLTMSYAGCSLVSQLLPKKIVYMDDDLSLLELIGGIDNFLTQKVTGKIEHFSSYGLWQ